jgi:hypothetical protein
MVILSTPSRFARPGFVRFARWRVRADCAACAGTATATAGGAGSADAAPRGQSGQSRLRAERLSGPGPLRPRFARFGIIKNGAGLRETLGSIVERVGIVSPLEIQFRILDRLVRGHAGPRVEPVEEPLVGQLVGGHVFVSMLVGCIRPKEARDRLGWNDKRPPEREALAGECNAPQSEDQSIVHRRKAAPPRASIVANGAISLARNPRKQPESTRISRGRADSLTA